MLEMFRSARIKLTMFYLAIIVVMSLMATVGIRAWAEHEYLRSNTMQRSHIKELVLDMYGVARPLYYSHDDAILDFQALEAAKVRHNLNQALFVVNLLALTIGGIISYWFAGRTLRPIEEAHAAQARFAADASHELRTPLTNMKLESEVFLRQKHFNEADARELISSNLEEIERLETLSGNLLALAQYDRTQLERAPADIHRLTQQAIAHVQKSSDAKGMTITQAVAPANVLVHTASTVQLLDIILDNAQKYGPQGGTITIQGSVQNNRYLLAICDQGPGISPADLPHIFDRLYRGDKARSSKVAGYGLGLALAREIARANQAVITARNADGSGACFELQFELA